MINCLKCGISLIINIDAKNKDFKCKECSEKYELLFEKKILKIIHKKKQLTFFINDLSNCDNEFSLKNVYEMYNKGYLDCVKLLNVQYNQSDNYWQLSINKLKEKISKNIELKINNLINSNTENYTCNSCMSTYSSQDALINNYSCIMCLKPLFLKNNLNEVDTLKKNLLTLEINWATLS
jgi:transcription initiation factor IIE alpha subunit